MAFAAFRGRRSKPVDEPEHNRVLIYPSSTINVFGVARQRLHKPLGDVATAIADTSHAHALGCVQSDSRASTTRGRTPIRKRHSRRQSIYKRRTVDAGRHGAYKSFDAYKRCGLAREVESMSRLRPGAASPALEG